MQSNGRTDEGAMLQRLARRGFIELLKAATGSTRISRSALFADLQSCIARRIGSAEFTHHVPVERLHDADARQRRWPGAAVRHKEQRFATSSTFFVGVTIRRVC